jgi:hypothetical protein
MSKSHFSAAILSALTITAMAWGPAYAAQLGCGSPLAAKVSLAETSAEAGFLLEEAINASFEVADARMQLSQTRLRSGSVRLPRRVPAGQTFAIQMDNSRSFNRFTSGSGLPGDLHCVQINCPSHFDAGTTCWRCEEEAAAE